jgi:hypothetical protein
VAAGKSSPTSCATLRKPVQVPPSARRVGGISSGIPQLM